VTVTTTLCITTKLSVYLETNGFIDTVEPLEPDFSWLQPRWLATPTPGVTVNSREWVILETLVTPRRDENRVKEKPCREFLNTPEVWLIPTTRESWEPAASWRAKYALHTPDAIPVATAGSLSVA
jgi:hypothetical protein